VERRENLKLSNTDPVSAVKKLFIVLFSEDLAAEKLKPVLSRQLAAGMDSEDSDEMRTIPARLRTLFAASGMPPDVVVDVVLGAMNFTTEGDDRNGFRIRVQGPNMDSTAYIIKEDGEYRILGFFSSLEYVGQEVLARAQRNDLDAARRLLDWVREDQRLAGADDPYAGPAFARFWEKGAEGGIGQIRYAAASLLASAPNAREAIDILKEGRAQARTDAERNSFDAALAQALITAKRFDEALPVVSRLYEAAPRSNTVFTGLIRTLESLGRVKDAEQITQQRLDRDPNDDRVVRVLMHLASVAGDPAKAQTFGKRLIALGRAQPGDLNNLAWESVVLGDVTPEAVRIGEQAVQANSADPSLLHTMASIYANLGEPVKARDLLVQSIEHRGELEPQSDDWYVLGRIAEDLGFKDAAVAAYNRVVKPKLELNLPDSVYLIAQRRLATIAKPR
jgi:tetratricopeptide (TPR) repeat protein